jgi:hypothetical protein
MQFEEEIDRLSLLRKKLKKKKTNNRLKLYYDQRNAQVFNLFLFTSALYVSGFLLAHLQRQVYNFGSGSRSS